MELLNQAKYKRECYIMKKEEIITKVVNVIIDTMEKKNVLPWDQGILPVNGIEAISWSTGKAYTGINRLVLNMAGNRNGEYATFNNIKQAGGKVRKGEKSLPVIYYMMWNKEEKRPAEKNDNPDDVVPLLRLYNVFDVTTQVDWSDKGYKSKRTEIPEITEVETDKNIDSMIDTFAINTNLIIEYDAVESAYYKPLNHSVHLYKSEYHKTLAGYYGTAFHELIHSTSKGLKRPLGVGFGSEKYSAEEIVAECGAMLLGNILGIATENENNNSAVYIAGWKKSIKENPSWLFEGITKAEKAVDYFLQNSK